MTDTAVRFSIGLEEGPDGTTRVHALDLPGCTAEGASAQQALDAFPEALSEWLRFLASVGDPVPPPEAEIEIAVDEWVRTEADVATGASDVCFEADLAPLTQAEITTSLHRLGDLRGRLLSRIRRLPDAGLDAIRTDEWTLRQILDELARAQWWTLTRLGASPMAEVPERTLGRLDTAMALVVQTFVEMPPEQRDAQVELDGELWTPRRVLRRLLWLEWSLGRAAEHTLTAND